MENGEIENTPEMLWQVFYVFTFEGRFIFRCNGFKYETSFCLNNKVFSEKLFRHKSLSVYLEI